MTRPNWSQLLFLGGGRPGRLKRQGYSQLLRELREDFSTGRSSGVLRALQLSLVLVTFAFPVVHIDTAADRVIQKCSRRPHTTLVDDRIVILYRDAYFLARALLLVSALFLRWHSLTFVRLLAGYFILEIVHAWLGRALAWGRRSINPTRAFILNLLGYAEVTVAFAILYLGCACVTNSTDATLALRPTTALYFSLVTAATVGFGDFFPQGDGYGIVMWQIFTSFVFVVLVISSLAPYLPHQVRRRTP